MHSRLARALAALTTAAFISLPFVASAQTIDAVSQIQSLLSQIQSLQQQLQTLMSSESAPSTWIIGSTTAPAPVPPITPPSTLGQLVAPCGILSRDLSEGESGGEVLQLQQFLSQQGFLSASSTGFFGPLTAHALALFQEHFGIASSSSAGFFGPLTRHFLSARCDGTPEGEGATTSPAFMWHVGTTTPPAVWFPGATTSAPMMPWRPSGDSSSSSPEHPMLPLLPCAQNDSQAGAAALFVPHVIFPGMHMPCGNGNANGSNPSSGPSAPTGGN